MAGAVVKVEILGDAKSALAAMDKVNAKSKTMGQRAQKLGKGMTKGVTLPVLAAGAALFAAAKRTGENADRLLDLNAQTGIATDKLQEMEQVAREAGVGQEFYSNAVKEVIKAGDALIRGVGPQSEAFDTLGISVLDANGNLRDASELTDEAMNALADIEDPTMRAALAQDIFARKYEDLLPVLALGKDGIAASREEAHELGAVMSGEALEAANEFRVTQEKLMASVGGLVAELGSGLAPILSQVTTFLTDNVVPAIRSFFDWVDKLPGPLKGVVLGIVGVAAAAGPMILVGLKVAKMFGAVGKAFTILSKLLMANPWLLLIAAIIALVIIVVKNWDTIKEVIGKAWQWIKDRTDDFIRGFKRILGAALDFVKNLFLNWTGPGLLIKHWDKIKAGATAVKDWIVDKFTAVIDWFKGMPAKVTSAVAGLWSGLRNGFRSTINSIIGWWNRLELKLGGQRIDLPFGMGFNIPTITLATPNIPLMAKGGIVARSGLAIVGEAGPELVSLGRGARVTPLPKGGGGPMHIHIEIDGKEIAAAIVNFEDGLA